MNKHQMIKHARQRLRRYHGGTVRTWEMSRLLLNEWRPTVRAGVYGR